ncbi:hypothetical protein [Micromonospora halophytica]|uniref:hypothetical protein n=1 Tax=Micromonospora halophytica TaxID=47864 RepID=UPI00147E7472
MSWPSTTGDHHITLHPYARLALGAAILGAGVVAHADRVPDRLAHGRAHRFAVGPRHHDPQRRPHRPRR